MPHKADTYVRGSNHACVMPIRSKHMLKCRARFGEWNAGSTSVTELLNRVMRIRSVVVMVIVVLRMTMAGAGDRCGRQDVRAG
jgi:hypothetical protein